MGLVVQDLIETVGEVGETKMKKIIFILLILVIVLTPLTFFVNENQSSGGINFSLEINNADAKSVAAREAEVESDGWGIWTSIKAGVANAMLFLSGAILFFGGVVLNYAINYTIVDMGMFIDRMVAIDEGWATFRDLANIFFIFVLLYIGISTILGLSSRAKKETLIRIVIVALLINFSLFFTKVMIDASNIVTIQFYKQIAISEQDDPLNSGLSWAFMRPMFLTSFFSPKSDGGGGFSGLEFRAADEIAKDSSGQNIFTIGVMGSIFMLITAFVFLATAILLIIRFAILVFLMVTSPLAYVASILPKAANYSNQWWDSLFKQLFFAPLLMMFLWFTAKLINSDGFRALVGQDKIGGSDFAAAIAGGSVGPVAVIMNFIIVIVFLVASLVVAQKAGATGGAWAVKSAKAVAGGVTLGAGGWVGRNTLGKASNYASEKLKDTRFATTLVGRNVVAGARGVAGTSFDARNLGDFGVGKAWGKGGYAGEVKTKIKSREEYAKSLGDKPIFADEKSRKTYQSLEKDKKAYQKTIDEYDKKLAEAVKDNDYGEVEEIKKEKAVMERNLKNNDKMMRRFTENKYLGTSPKAAFAENISLGGKRTWKKPSAWWVGSADKQAGKKIRDSIKTNPDKKLKEAIKEATKGDGGEQQNQQGNQGGGNQQNQQQGNQGNQNQNA